jgi:uridine kinase
MRNLILISGGSGSGKSLLVKGIKGAVGSSCVVIPQDNYYLNADQYPEHLIIKGKYKQGPDLDYDHVDAFNWDLMTKHIEMLISGNPVDMPLYDYSISASSETVRIEPAEFIILEGIFTFHNPHIRDLSNSKIFVHVDADTRLARRILRDVLRRDRDIGLTPELDQDEVDVIMHYLDHVKPGYDRFVEPTKQFADLIVNNNEFSTSPAMIPETLKFLNIG